MGPLAYVVMRVCSEESGKQSVGQAGVCQCWGVTVMNQVEWVMQELDVVSDIKRMNDSSNLDLREGLQARVWRQEFPQYQCKVQCLILAAELWQYMLLCFEILGVTILASILAHWCYSTVLLMCDVPSHSSYRVSCEWWCYNLKGSGSGRYKEEFGVHLHYDLTKTTVD